MLIKLKISNYKLVDPYRETIANEKKNFLMYRILLYIIVLFSLSFSSSNKFSIFINSPMSLCLTNFKHMYIVYIGNVIMKIIENINRDIFNEFNNL